jgi:hypothetical protein
MGEYALHTKTQDLYMDNYCDCQLITSAALHICPYTGMPLAGPASLSLSLRIRRKPPTALACKPCTVGYALHMPKCNGHGATGTKGANMVTSSIHVAGCMVLDAQQPPLLSLAVVSIPHGTLHRKHQKDDTQQQSLADQP